MGYDLIKLELVFVARVSRHNDHRDARDDDRLEQLAREVEQFEVEMHREFGDVIGED